MMPYSDKGTPQTVNLTPSFKRYRGLLVGLLVALIISYLLGGHLPNDRSDIPPDRLESIGSQPITSTRLNLDQTGLNLGLAMPQDWSPSPPGPAEVHKQIISRLYTDVLDTGNFKPAEALFSEDFTYHEAGASAGLTTYRQKIETDHATYYKLRYRIEDMVAEEDQVVVRWLASGTPLATFETHPPTGQPLVWRGVTIWQVREGEIVSAWTVFD